MLSGPAERCSIIGRIGCSELKEACPRSIEEPVFHVTASEKAHNSSTVIPAARSGCERAFGGLSLCRGWIASRFALSHHDDVVALGELSASRVSRMLDGLARYIGSVTSERHFNLAVPR